MHVSMSSNTSGTAADVSPNLMGQQQQQLFDEHAAALINSQLLLSSAPGLEILYEACRQVYPQQENPLQVTAFIKYWYVPNTKPCNNWNIFINYASSQAWWARPLGLHQHLRSSRWLKFLSIKTSSQELLYFFSIQECRNCTYLHIFITSGMHTQLYKTKSVSSLHFNKLSHSFGLTDLHGDARVHEPSGPEFPSGFGFELTFRLMKPSGGSPSPPTWPAALLQSLAKYGTFASWAYLREHVIYCLLF